MINEAERKRLKRGRLRTRRELRDSFGMGGVTTSFAISAVKLKIEPQRAQRTQRVMGNSFVLKVLTESFASSACSAITLKIKPRRTLSAQRFLAVSASVLYKRSMEVEDDKKTLR